MTETASAGPIQRPYTIYMKIDAEMRYCLRARNTFQALKDAVHMLLDEGYEGLHLTSIDFRIEDAEKCPVSSGCHISRSRKS